MAKEQVKLQLVRPFVERYHPTISIYSLIIPYSLSFGQGADAPGTVFIAAASTLDTS